MRNKDIRDILPDNNRNLHLVPQIICGTADELNRLCDVIQEHGYNEIDINMGCPAPMQTKHHRGSGILHNPALVEEVAKELEHRPEVHFSVKMRLGLQSPDEWQVVLPILNDVSLHHVTLHPRIGTQMYKGEVNMNAFREFANSCKHPLVYNGDVRSTDDLNRISQHFPFLSGVMIGRGLLSRPTLAKEYVEKAELTESQRKTILLAMHEDMFQFCREKYKADSQILLHIHAFWEYQEEFLGRKLWKKIMKAGSMKNYLTAVDMIRNNRD